MLGHRFQQPDGAIDPLGDRSPALGGAIDHIDLRLRLIGSKPMRLEHQISGIPGVAIIPGAAVLALLRQLGLLGKIFEFFVTLLSSPLAAQTIGGLAAAQNLTTQPSASGGCALCMVLDHSFQ
jgi:hypothetical protein